MPKRKRSEQPEDDTAVASSDERPQKQNPEDRKVARQASRLSQKYEHGAQTLHKALKTARGFERQKLGRRQKTARSNNNEADLQRMEAEVHALKSMDLAITAERYLFKQLAKTKRIAESPAFAKFKESKPISIEGPRDTAEANVIARLMKSNPVKNVMPGIMGGIRELLGLDDAAAAAAADAKKVKASKGEDAEEDGGKDEIKPAKLKRDETKTQAQRQEQDDVSSGEEDDGEGDGEEGEGSENANDSDADSMDYSKFDSRLAPSSGESDEGSDSEEEEEDAHPKASNTKPSRYDRARDLSLSPTPSASSSESPPPTSLKGTKKPAAPASKAPTKSTTFLPSLMMGGYWSGSESEPEDLDSADPPRRKNRMGQKARRALWEKKYGDKANHIQKEKQKQKQSRDSGWDMRRGATDADDGNDARGGKRGKGGVGAGAGKPQSGQQGAGPNNNKKSAEDRKKTQQQQQKKKKAQMDNKPLHPSWEAARRQKEQKAQASFQGKKIVFD